MYGIKIISPIMNISKMKIDPGHFWSFRNSESYLSMPSFPRLNGLVARRG